MYLTNEKTKHSSWVGSYKTRKWNDVTSIIYFEKVYGGKSLLKRIKLEKEKVIIIQSFNFLLYQENFLSRLFLLQVVFLYDQAFDILFANE